MVSKYFTQNPLVGAFSVVKVEIFSRERTIFVKSVLTIIVKTDFTKMVLFVLLCTQRSFLFQQKL